MKTTLFQSGVEVAWEMVLTFKWRRVLRLFWNIHCLHFASGSSWCSSIQRRGGFRLSFSKLILWKFYINFKLKFFLPFFLLNDATFSFIAAKNGLLPVCSWSQWCELSNQKQRFCAFEALSHRKKRFSACFSLNLYSSNWDLISQIN